MAEISDQMANSGQHSLLDEEIAAHEETAGTVVFAIDL